MTQIRKKTTEKTHHKKWRLKKAAKTESGDAKSGRRIKSFISYSEQKLLTAPDNPPVNNGGLTAINGDAVIDNGRRTRVLRSRQWPDRSSAYLRIRLRLCGPQRVDPSRRDNGTVALCARAGSVRVWFCAFDCWFVLI